MANISTLATEEKKSAAAKVESAQNKLNVVAEERKDNANDIAAEQELPKVDTAKGDENATIAVNDVQENKNDNKDGA